MRRVAAVAAGALGLLAAQVGTAFAGSEVPVPGQDGGQVGGEVVRPLQEVAFTGANIQLWMVLATALAVVGLLLLVASWRRNSART